jgi:DNA-directed RNA polymerase subunit RPC12/RpoP
MWGPKCKKCGKGPMSYTSDRTGNVRRYRCPACGSVWLATLKGMMSASVMGEPKGIQDNDVEWVRVIQ